MKGRDVSIIIEWTTVILSNHMMRTTMNTHDHFLVGWTFTLILFYIIIWVWVYMIYNLELIMTGEIILQGFPYPEQWVHDFSFGV